MVRVGRMLLGGLLGLALLQGGARAQAPVVVAVRAGSAAGAVSGVGVVVAAGDRVVTGCMVVRATSATVVTADDGSADQYVQVARVGPTADGGVLVVLSARASVAGPRTVSCRAPAGTVANQNYTAVVRGSGGQALGVGYGGASTPATGAVPAGALLLAFCESGRVSLGAGWTSLSTVNSNLLASAPGGTAASFAVSQSWNLVVVGLPAAPPPPAVDTTPPTVQVTAPNTGTDITGAILVRADAADDSGVLPAVQILLDGAPLAPPQAAPPYSALLDTSAVFSGPHTLTAVATDGAGNKTTSAPVGVVVVGQLFEFTFVYDDGTPYAPGGHLVIAEALPGPAPVTWMTDFDFYGTPTSQYRLRWPVRIGTVYTISLDSAAGVPLWRTGAQLSTSMVPSVAAIISTGGRAVLTFSKATGSWTDIVLKVNY